MTKDIEVYTPSKEDQEFVSQGEIALAYVRDTQIVDQSSYDVALTWLKRLKIQAEAIETRRTMLVKPLNDHVKSINNWLKRPLDILKQAENQMKELILIWNRKQEEIRMIEQRRIQKEKEVEEAKRQKELEKLAKKAEKAGATDTAESIRITASRPLIVPEVPKTFKEQGGVQTKDHWIYEVEDFNKIPREWLIVDDKKLSAYAKATQGGNPIPGIVFKNKPILAVNAWGD